MNVLNGDPKMVKKNNRKKTFFYAVKNLQIFILLPQHFKTLFFNFESKRNKKKMM